jgi:hypothetical protein
LRRKYSFMPFNLFLITPRITLVAIATMLFPLFAQAQDLGGCADGKELGYIRVQSRVPLVEWSTGKTFAEAQPGDELRLCRVRGDVVIVTLWVPGYGYMLPLSAVDSARAPTFRDQTAAEKGCLIRDITRIQEQFASFGQNREFLLLSRKRNVSLSQISAVRLEAARAYGQGKQALLPTCPEP